MFDKSGYFTAITGWYLWTDQTDLPVRLSNATLLGRFKSDLSCIIKHLACSRLAVEDGV